MSEDAITYAAVGSITKAGPPEDGVWSFEVSKATGPELDLDQQVVDMSWAVPAMREWFETGGNIREQHDPKRAVGKALTLEERGDGAYIAGKVIDRDAGPKLEHGIFNGLSIGIKAARVIKDKLAPNGRIVGGKIVEVSLVDRPANPTSKLVLAKAAGADGEFEAVEELVELAERVDHSHSHEHSEGHHKHSHVHGPRVKEHRSMDSGVAHNHSHSEEQSESIVGNDDGPDTVQPKDAEADIEKAKLKAKTRDALPDSDFALPDSREYPIHDENHARAALSMLHNASPEDQKKIKAAVHRRYPDMGQDDDKTVAPDWDAIQSALLDLTELVKAAKPTKANPDPDDDGDDDTSASGDTDHDFWNEDGTPTAKGRAAGLKAKTLEPDEIKAAVAEATKEIEAKWAEKVTSLDSQMAEILKTPIPGAVTRTRPIAAAQASARITELELERDRYYEMAAGIFDPNAAKGYLELAREKAAEIDKEKGQS
ncbi:MAG: hypothetical protein WBF51_04280 [Candidatus Dormiibacterota bacterium]